MDNKTEAPGFSGLRFTEQELKMLGQTADALSAYMGAVILAEVGQGEESEWVIFGRAIGQDEEVDEDIFHVQLGGKNARLLGQTGRLDTTPGEAYDCEFLWAIEITDDEDERFVRINQEGEIFDAASDLATLLPFSLIEPDMPDTDEDDDGYDPNEDDDLDYDGFEPGQGSPDDGSDNGGQGKPPTLH